MDDNLWIYAAWFRDLQLSPDDQDYEWVTVIGIRAPSAQQAQEWGDRIARRADGSDGNRFLWSEVHTRADPRYGPDTDWSGMPVVDYGVDAAMEW